MFMPFADVQFACEERDPSRAEVENFTRFIKCPRGRFRAALQKTSNKVTPGAASAAVAVANFYNIVTNKRT